MKGKDVPVATRWKAKNKKNKKNKEKQSAFGFLKIKSLGGRGGRYHKVNKVLSPLIPEKGGWYDPIKLIILLEQHISSACWFYKALPRLFFLRKLENQKKRSRPFFFFCRLDFCSKYWAVHRIITFRRSTPRTYLFCPRKHRKELHIAAFFFIPRTISLGLRVVSPKTPPPPFHDMHFNLSFKFPVARGCRL